MDPITAGLFVAASFASSLVSNKNQATVAESQNKLQIEQSRLQTAEAAFERTKQFKQNLSLNLAYTGIGVGGVSGFKGVMAQNVQDFAADQASLGRQDLFAQLTGTANRALNRAKNFTNAASSVIDAATLSRQLGLFDKKGK